MWMEAKAMFSVISIIMIAVVLSQLLFVNILFGLLLIIGIGMIIVGDIIIGVKISDFKPLYDPTPRGWDLMELQMLDGKVYFMNTRKGAHGKRSFRINHEDASVINDGKSGFILANGNKGFRAHESYDMNVDPFVAKALEKTKGRDIKEAYYRARDMLDRGVKDE